MIIHVTKPGDTPYSIAQRYSVPLSRLIADNSIADLLFLPVGMALIVNNDTQLYTVRPGQSLYSIARSFGVSPEEILELNPQIESPENIQPGDVISIPTEREKLKSIYVNGYAYTSISPQTLRRTLPSLTYVSPFSYEVKSDGTFSPIPDSFIIANSRAAGVAPMMVLTNIDDSGGFSGEIMRLLITQNSEVLFDNVLAAVKEKNYNGVSLDFEYIPSDLRDEYSDFVRRFAEVMHANGYEIVAAVPPKTSAQQSGVLYEGFDYGALGSVLDKVIIMTYEWGYTYGPPQAVAPLNQVENVIRYALTEMNADKIMMSIPNYGYDWQLPYMPGTPARTVTNTYAPQLAARYGAEIMFDEQAKTPYFYYTDGNGRNHVVWFEDARSISAKLSLIDKYSLAGVSYWTVNNYFTQMYLLQNYMYDVIKVPLV